MNNITTFIGFLIIIINVIFICFLVFKHRKKSFILWHSLAIALLMITLTIAFFIIQLYSVEKDTDLFPFLRNILLIVSGTVAIISLLMTSYNASVTSKNSLETHRANVIFNLIKNNSSLMESEGFKSSLEKLTSEITKFHESKYKFLMASNQLRDYILNHKREFKNAVQNEIKKKNPHAIHKDISELIANLDSEEALNFETIQRLLVSYYRVANVGTLRENFNDQYDKGNTFKSFYTELRSTSFGMKLEEYIEENNSLISEKLNYKEFVDRTETIFSPHYDEIGPFLRNTHRIVKLINEYFSDPVERKNYLGILRSYYSTKVMSLLYVNCVFTKRGYGLSKQLLESDFFGDSDDISTSNGPHLIKENLFHATQNEKILLLFTIGNKEIKKRLKTKKDNQHITELENIFAEIFDLRNK